MAEDDQYLDNLEAWVCEENKIVRVHFIPGRATKSSITLIEFRGDYVFPLFIE
jgi:hypothetical protein